ncbi:MAG: Uma2 family endonuclease [Planctomycetaceae bacterium]|nr:Uma2 family endonuclease [Planctomycetaceae bacterium]
MATLAQADQPPLLFSGQRLDREEFYRRVDEFVARGGNPRGIERLEQRVQMPQPIPLTFHGEPQGHMVAWLGHYVAATRGCQGSGSATVVLDADNDPEPDCVLRIRPEYGGESRTDRSGYVDGAPELVVEVADSTAVTDLQLKFEIYRRNGVLEYLVWETIAEDFYWFVLQEGEYHRVSPDADGVIHSRVYPGLWLDVTALLKGDLARVLAVVQQGVASPEHAEFVARLDGQRKS